MADLGIFGKARDYFQLGIAYTPYELDYRKYELLSNNPDEEDLINEYYNKLLEVLSVTNKNASYKEMSINAIKEKYNKLNIDNSTLEQKIFTVMTNSVLNKIMQTDDEEEIRKNNILFSLEYDRFINNLNNKKEVKEDQKNELLLDLVKIVNVSHENYKQNKHYNDTLKDEITSILDKYINVYNNDEVTNYINGVLNDYLEEIDNLIIESNIEFENAKKRFIDDITNNLIPYCNDLCSNNLGR